MKKNVGLIFVLMLLTFSSDNFAAEETFQQIECIDFQGEDVRIILSDKTECIANIKPCEIAILETWIVDDRVRIEKHPNSPGLILSNLSDDILYFPKIKLTQESLRKLPTIVDKKIVRNESSMDMTLYLSLSDGSTWKYDLWDFEVHKFNFWKAGDKVILNVDFEGEAVILNYNVAMSKNHLYSEKFFFEEVVE